MINGVMSTIPPLAEPSAELPPASMWPPEWGKGTLTCMNLLLMAAELPMEH
jgi:hypothetical protein